MVSDARPSDRSLGERRHPTFSTAVQHPDAAPQSQSEVRGGHELHVPLPAVTFGCHSHDDAEVLQHAQMVGHQVASHAQHLCQFGQRTVGEVEGIDDGRTVRIAQGAMQTGSSY